MKKAIEWIKANVISILLAIIGILGAGILWRYHKKRVDELKDRADILEAQQNIKSLNDQRKIAETATAKKEELVKAIDKKILENKRKIVEAHEYVETLNDEQVLEEFARLGY